MNLPDTAVRVFHFAILALMVIYTIQSVTVFGQRRAKDRDRTFALQNIEMFIIHFLGFLILFLKSPQTDLIIFYASTVLYLLFTLLLFRNLYPRASRSLINNMCMLLVIGFIMVTRFSIDQSIKQFEIAAAGTVLALLIPLIVRKLLVLTRMTWGYVFVGIGLLGLVVIAARVTNGAKLSLTVAGFSLQPSEFVKIIFVFAVAGLLSTQHSFRRVVIATVLAALHILILVVSTDLGSALIFFVTYLVMLFVATRNPFLTLIGLFAFCIAAVAAYFLFSHVRVRVQIWMDPFRDYSGTGYQICQSLFAIAAGGWIGTGLCQGSPGAIPYVSQDFMFSAILEELGAVFGICLIIICLAVFMMFINIAMKLGNRFYRLAALGLGTTYATQVFLTIGGGTKLIPMTGVTLPLVSYGGSSVLSTIIMFAIVQGLYMLRGDEVRRELQDPEREARLMAQRMQRYGDAPGRVVRPSQEAAGRGAKPLRPSREAAGRGEKPVRSSETSGRGYDRTSQRSTAGRADAGSVRTGQETRVWRQDHENRSRQGR